MELNKEEWKFKNMQIEDEFLGKVLNTYVRCSEDKDITLKQLLEITKCIFIIETHKETMDKKG